jgi:hypothetical protein
MSAAVHAERAGASKAMPAAYLKPVSVHVRDFPYIARGAHSTWAFFTSRHTAARLSYASASAIAHNL